MTQPTNIHTCTTDPPLISDTTDSTVSDSATLSTPLILLFAIACGLSVANMYYIHPMLNVIATDLHMDAAMSGSVITVTQLCYALGLLLLVPLGDRVPRRLLITGQMLLSVICLLFTALASGSFSFWIGIGAMGGLAVVAQTIVAAAASLSSPTQRGRTVGTVTSAIVIGILSARVIAGWLTDWSGWRSVYLCSAILLFIVALLIYRYFPVKAVSPSTCPYAPRLSYSELVWSTLQLFRELPILRIRAVLAMLTFAAFSTLWTTLVFPLSTAPFTWSHSAIGMLGIAGLAGALAASRAGRWADRGWMHRTSGGALVLLALSWLFTWQMYDHVWWLLVGIILLDLAVQAVHVTSQSMILAARPEAGSRLTGGYMIFYSIGSATGSLTATWVYAAHGWNGVCYLGLGYSLAALLFWSWTWRTQKDRHTEA
ncbi:MFS transporter [Paenibacillus kandeliae]|uniref:MFS transporter n=1 Tax=Paenibacillus kandeliae TaxID=3231269 RepID=UPI00345B1244